MYIAYRFGVLHSTACGQRVEGIPIKMLCTSVPNIDLPCVGAFEQQKDSELIFRNVFFRACAPIPNPDIELCQSICGSDGRGRLPGVTSRGFAARPKRGSGPPAVSEPAPVPQPAPLPGQAAVPRPTALPA